MDGGPTGVVSLTPETLSRYYDNLPDRFKVAYDNLASDIKKRGDHMTKGEAALMFAIAGFPLTRVLEVWGFFEK